MGLNKRTVSLKHLLAMLYVFMVVLLAVLLAHEMRRDAPKFTLTRVSAAVSQEQVGISILGEELHAGIKGVIAKTLVNEQVQLWRQLAGVLSTAVDVRGDLALLSCRRNKLVSIALDDGGRSKILGSVELPESIKHLRIVGDQALVGLERHAGISLIDLKDPGNMQLVRHYPHPGLVSGMVVDRQAVYFTNLYEGVGWIDLSAKDPVPEMLISLDSPWRIALRDNKLVVGTVKGGVRLFDIIQGGQLADAGNLDYQDVRGVAFSGEVLAVALADGSLHLLDLSTWPSMSELAQLTLPGSPFLCEAIPGRVGFAVGLIAGGMVLVDSSRPEAPTISGVLKRAETFKGMKLLPDKAYCATRNGLELFSLDKIYDSNFSSLAEEAMIDQDYYQLRSWNGHVYGYGKNRLLELGKSAPTGDHFPSRFMAISEEKGIGLFGQGDAGQVERIGTLIAVEGAREAKFREGCLYIIFENGLRILSGTNPNELSVVGELELPGRPEHFKILDSGYLVISTYHSGVLVVDVRDPRHPEQVASLITYPYLQPINVLHDVLVAGSRAYLSLGAGGVHIFDMSVPDKPELKQVVHTPGTAKGMALFDNLLLVADGVSGLFIIDVENSENARLVGFLPTPLRIDQIAVADDGLIVSGHPGGTMRLPLPRRMGNLEYVNTSELRVEVDKVEKGQYVFLYDDRTAEQMAVSVR